MSPNSTSTTASGKPAFVKGLDGIVAVQTHISMVDGANSNLSYRGINVNELVVNATYEEVAFLLLHDHLPSRNELADFNARLVANRWLPAPLYDLLRQLPRDTVPMEALRTAVSALSFYGPEIEDISIEATQRKAVRLISQFPTICAAYQRIREGKEPIAPTARLSHAANTLHMLGLRSGDADFVKAMDAYYVLLADHGMNASTFTGRVVASTQADLHSSITAAMAALTGPLHGGATEATMNMLLEVDDPAKVDAFVDNAFATKRKIMGIGHRIHKNGDPRSVHLNAWAERLGQLYPNVDFYSGIIYKAMGIPPVAFTVMFALGRLPGWIAHSKEYSNEPGNKINRPRQIYIGEPLAEYVSIEKRK